MKEKIIAVLITIILGIFVIFASANKETFLDPQNVFEVYINGKTLGYIKSEDEFLALVDDKQEEIKNEYNVAKVYPPDGLKIEKIATYSNNIKSSEEIYNTLEKNEPFTINGYLVTINYKEEDKKPVTMQILNKEDFENAFYNTIAAFVGTEELASYKNKSQKEITETGQIIESIYWDETITIKESLISTADYIFTNEDDISKYLLFGTLEEQKKYTVKSGDTIDSILDKNNLSIEEFLVANPEIVSANALLASNQEVSIGLISPIVNIINENKIVEDIVDNYKTEYKKDNTMYTGQEKVIQAGSNGLNRVTEQIQYKNGEIQGFIITGTTEIKPTISEIIAKGTKTRSSSSSTSSSYTGSSRDKWYWPTLTPYKITSRFGYRWGSLHNGVDISGTGKNSPIYASNDGLVVKTGYHNSMGNYIYIDHGNNEYTVYMHLNKILVKAGQTVERGEQIGKMGSTGHSTGTHLHFTYFVGYPYVGGKAYDPCKTIVSC